MRPVLLVPIALLVFASGCAPAIGAAASTPAGQAAIEKAVQRGLARAGLAPAAGADGDLALDEGESAASLLAGPMLADVTHRGAAVWVLTDRPAEVRVVATPASDSAAVVEGSIFADGTGTATVRLADLEPGTTYRYSVSIDGADAGSGRLRTQPLWQYRTDPPTFTAALGSCYYDNDPAYDRPGTPYGGSPAIFGEIAALRPDLMLWLGDNTYLREVDWWDAAGIESRFRHSRSEPALQPLLASTAHYGVWDDHDYGPNDSDRSYVLKGASYDTFSRYWPAGARGLPDVPGMFTQFQWADVEFFVLDDRWHRAPNDAPARERQILGPEQRQWLLDALTASQAPFKVVAVGGQFLNPVAVYETFANVAPAERQTVLNEIAARRIEGVVFLSGDRHHTELLKLDRPGAYPIYEFTSSPLTAGGSTAPLQADSPERDNPLRVPGTLVAGPRNFGTMTVSGPRTDRTMTLRTYGADGALLWEQAIRARDLRLAGRE